MKCCRPDHPHASFACLPACPPYGSCRPPAQHSVADAVNCVRFRFQPLLQASHIVTCGPVLPGGREAAYSLGTPAPASTTSNLQSMFPGHVFARVCGHATCMKRKGKLADTEPPLLTAEGAVWSQVS